MSQGLIYCDPSRELNFWRPTPSALLALGLRSHTDIPALKELEEWFDSQKEIRAIAKLDPFFERTSKLASRRLKREIERRGTLGEFALEPDPPHLKRIPTEESGSDLFRSDGPDAVELCCVESPQSVVQGCPAQGSAVGARGKGVVIGSIGEICGRAAVGLAGPAEALRADFISPATSETFGELLSKNPSAFRSPIFEHRDFWSRYTPNYLAKSLLEIVAVSPRNVVNEGCPSYSMKPIQRIRHVLLRTTFSN